MADDFRLLFKTIVLEPPALDQRISVAAEWMAHERQVKASALLRLPHMGEFVDEDPLLVQGLTGEIFRPEVRMGVEMDVPCRRHCDVAGLKRPPSAADHANLCVIDRIAEHASGEFDLSGSQWP